MREGNSLVFNLYDYEVSTAEIYNDQIGTQDDESIIYALNSNDAFWIEKMNNVFFNNTIDYNG